MSNSNTQDTLHGARGRGRAQSRGRGSFQQDQMSNTQSSSINARGGSALQPSTSPGAQTSVNDRQLPFLRGRGSGRSQRRGQPATRGPQILQRQSGLQPPLPVQSPEAQSTASSGTPRWAKPSDFQPLKGPPSPETYVAQCEYLENVAKAQIPRVLMTADEVREKQTFIAVLSRFCEEASISSDSDGQPEATLKAFGSFASGFATKGSDVDLAVVSTKDGETLPDPSLELHEDGMPRKLEKYLLDNGIGARLLTRTRVPILRVCEKPTPELLAALRQEREKWSALPNAQKYHGLHEDENDTMETGDTLTRYNTVEPSRALEGLGLSQYSPQAREQTARTVSKAIPPQTSSAQNRPIQPEKRPWLRQKKPGLLDFPKAGVGVTSDINFTNPLAQQNTLLLRCYCLCDERVKLMVLFVKAWVERRKINSAYSGTLSSYGYVLMVLHFLINVAQPSVVPNLQVAWYMQSEATKATTPHNQIWFKHYDIRFFRDIDEIQKLASQGRITQNKDPLPVLLRNFFHYFAKQGPDVPSGGFAWRNDVLSLRTTGGLLTKEDKDWVQATTEIIDGREVRQRYLFAIEDPFEVEHNVARVVTHPGLVTIRDEFRRAWNILQSVGHGKTDYPDLFEKLVEPEWEDKRATTDAKEPESMGKSKSSDPMTAN